MSKSNGGKLRNAQKSVDGEVRLDRLDRLDREVVARLQADGRRPFAGIAEELDVAESVVRYRVQRMERAGILQVVGIADPLKLGFDLMALVGVRVRSGRLTAVCEAISGLAETSYVAAVAGQFDVFVELVCRDTKHFQSVLVDGLQAIDGVESTESFLILEIHKMAYGWGVGDVGVPLAHDHAGAVTDSADRADDSGAPAAPSVPARAPRTRAATPRKRSSR